MKNTTTPKLSPVDLERVRGGILGEGALTGTPPAGNSPGFPRFGGGAR